MVRRHVRRRRWLAVTLGLIATAPAHAELACTFDQMQANAAAVIDPCSKALDSGLLVDADKAQAFYVRGRAYARTGRTQLAAQDLDVAIKLAPTRSDIYVSRANAEGKLGRREEEWADLQRALTLNPKETRAWFTIGQEYRNAGDLDQALTAFNNALAIDQNEPYSLLSRSEIRASQHQFAEALSDATALVNIPSATINKLGYVGNRGIMSNFHVIALNNRASLYERMGDEAAAARDLDDAIAEQPSASTYLHRAETLLRQKRFEVALKDADEAARLDPSDGDVQYLLGLVLTSLNRYADGLDAFDKAIAAHSKIVVKRSQLGSDYLMRARMQRGLGKTDDAVATLVRAVAISPETRESTIAAMNLRGYWKVDAPTQGDDFQAALRACMIDKDCN